MKSPSPRRKLLRLPEYDYSQIGAYFITVVTQHRANLFGKIVDGEMILSPAGEALWKWWDELGKKFSGVNSFEFIAMPNHIHGILIIESGNASISLGKIVGWYKSMTTNEYIRGVKRYGWPPFEGRLWQRNYYEHIIRSDFDFDNASSYIQTNPDRWETDEEYG